jgi:hypothetical protein
MRNARRTHWGLALVLVIGATLLAGYITMSIRQSNMSQGGAMPADMTQGAAVMADQSSQTMPTAPTGSSMMLIALVPNTLGILGGILIGAVAVFGLGVMLGGKASFRQIFPVVVWSSVPLALRQVVHTAVTLATGQTVAAGISGALTRTEAAAAPILNTLFEKIDLYLIWQLVLLGLGIAVTARLSKGKSLLIILIYLALSAGLLIGGSLILQSIMGLVGGSSGMPGPRMSF